MVGSKKNNQRLKPHASSLAKTTRVNSCPDTNPDREKKSAKRPKVRGKKKSAKHNFIVRGEWVEMQFMAKATRHGVVVARPFGDRHAYDFIVEYKGRFARVQVKGTAAFTGTAYTVATTARDGSPRYKENAFEFFAFFIVPLDVWYIIPKRAVRRAKKRVSLRPMAMTSRYAPFMEGWDLLKQEVKRSRA